MNRLEKIGERPAARYTTGVSEPNPYQSPVLLDQPSELDGFYTSKLTALRCAEIWRLSSNWSDFLNVALAKALGWPIPSNTAIKVLEPLKVLGEDELPDAAREKLLPAIDSSRGLGMRPAFYCTNEREGPNEAFACHCLSQSGTIGAGHIWVRVRAMHIIREQLTCVMQSWIDRGEVLSTSNQRRNLDAPEMFERMHLPGASMAQLLRIHTERLQTISPGRVMSLDRDGLLERLNANKRLIAEFHIRRGFWVPRRDESVTVSAIT